MKNKKYFKVEDTPYHKGKFVVQSLKPFYDYVGFTDSSYNVYQARAFGLTYGSYLKMARDLYNGTIIGKGHKYPMVIFDNEEDVKRLVDELNIRFNYLVNHYYEN